MCRLFGGGTWGDHHAVPKYQNTEVVSNPDMRTDTMTSNDNKKI